MSGVCTGEKENWCLHWDNIWKKNLSWLEKQWDALRSHEFAFPWGPEGLSTMIWLSSSDHQINAQI